MTTPVSFELAKLLIQKEYDLHPDFKDSYPTITEVVMWLYEKHGIWIGVQPNEPYVDDDWCFTIFKDLKNNNSLEGYNSPTEAYEVAIEYTLKNLINERIQI